MFLCLIFKILLYLTFCRCISKGYKTIQTLSVLFNCLSLFIQTLWMLSVLKHSKFVHKIWNYFFLFPTGIGLVCFNKRFDLLLSKEENAEARQFLYSVRVIMETTHNEFRRLPFYKLFETSSYKEFVKAKIFVKEYV